VLSLAPTAALNLLWLGITLSALAWIVRQEVQHGERSRRWAIFRRFLTVVLAAATLFPAISASDDLFTYSVLNAQMGGGSGNTVPVDPAGKASIQLALEGLEQGRTSLVFAFALFLLCICCLRAFRPLLTPLAVVCLGGRAPPSA